MHESYIKLISWVALYIDLKQLKQLYYSLIYPYLNYGLMSWGNTYTSSLNSGEDSPTFWSCKCKFFCVYRPYKEPIFKEMNNDNHLNFYLHDQMSGWLRY